MLISFRERAPEIGEVDLILLSAGVLCDEISAMVPKPGRRIVVTDSAARLHFVSGRITEMHEPDMGEAAACRPYELFHRGEDGMPRIGRIEPWPKVRVTCGGAYEVTLGKVEVGVGKEQLMVTITLIKKEDFVGSHGGPQRLKKRRLLPVIVGTRMSGGKRGAHFRWQLLESKRVEKQS